MVITLMAAGEEMIRLTSDGERAFFNFQIGFYFIKLRGFFSDSRSESFRRSGRRREIINLLEVWNSFLQERRVFIEENGTGGALPLLTLHQMHFCAELDWIQFQHPTGRNSSKSSSQSERMESQVSDLWSVCGSLIESLIMEQGMKVLSI